MRPHTLSKAFERVVAREPLAKALAEVLDEFYLQPDRAGRSRVLADPPTPTGDSRLDALAGGMAEYLAKGFDAAIPAWAVSRAAISRSHGSRCRSRGRG
jgi:hypothetical protein